MKVFRFIKKVFPIRRILIIATIAILVLLITIAIQMFYPFPTVVFKNEPFPILERATDNNPPGKIVTIKGIKYKEKKTPVKTGELLLHSVDQCLYTTAETTVTRTLIGPAVITTAVTNSTPPLGCNLLLSANTVIPDYAIPGIYYLRINACYHVTKYQTICKQIRTQDFEVIKGKD